MTAEQLQNAAEEYAARFRLAGDAKRELLRLLTAAAAAPRPPADCEYIDAVEVRDDPPGRYPRGIGRTTGHILEAFAKATLNPGVMIDFYPNCPATNAARILAICAKTYGLNYGFLIAPGRVRVVYRPPPYQRP